MKANINLKGLMAAVSMLLSVSLFAQQHTVTGTVVDADNGQPLVGVAVMVSTGGGVVTDANGSYAVSASDNATLTFNTLGYLDVVETVGGRSVINVKMTVDTEQLEEVVVLGYTSQKKNELSSSVVSLSADKLKDVTSPDLGNMLQGKAAGVLVTNASGQPGDGAKIRIRGTGSITAGAGPLYVVDGVAGGSFNPNDVETLTVLKDASATALYGAAASGGVIVVTTKSAKTDEATVTLKATAGIKKALSGRFSPMNSQELYDLQKQIYSKTLFKIQRPEALLEQDFDWMDEAFNLGVVQDYYVSAAGKAGRVNYFASISHYDEDGTLINTNHKRSSARVNLSAPLGKNVNMALRVNYDRAKSQYTSSYVTLECAYRALPWDNPYVIDADGNQTSEPLFINSAVRGDGRADQTWYSHDKYNFLHNELYNFNISESEDIMADLVLNWNITDWLMFSTTNRFNSSNWFNESYIDPRTKLPSVANGEISNSFGSGWGFGTTNLLKANKDFGDHSVNGVVGIEYGEGFSRSTSASGTDMPAGQASLSNAVMQSVGGYHYQSRSWAWLAQAQYSYKGRYIASASVRYDETSRFAPKARGGYFPGVSAAWLINKEDWMSGVPAFSLLKLRAGYGKTGNDAIENFLWQDIYSLSAQYQGIVAAVLQRQQNPNLGWEEAYMTSVGIDMELYNRVNVTLDLYNIDNKNLLLAVPLAPSTGFFEFMDNVGTVNNKGIELAVDADIIDRGDWYWNFGFNVGFNKNKVVHLPNGEFRQGLQIVREGQDIFTWNMPIWAGVDPETGSPMWEKVNEDGTIEHTNIYAEATYQNAGTSSPKFQGGLSTMLRWKGITLSATGNFIYGNMIYNSARVSMDSDGAYTDYNMMSIDNGLGWTRWQQPGDIATHPQPKMNGNNDAHSTSTRYLESGSHFRLKNVTLSYDFPQAWMKKAKMKGLKVYVSGDNLVTFSRFSGMDPEIDTEYGTYDTNYPVPMTVVGGIQITF
ncbi:MAG: SusC/RagA family TonB-linked outer membrane protein [Bacteroidales bacterium]|nr:SusC/RagA family TonB-linked outer membrane protein [Bacteroidales bacterium]